MAEQTVYLALGSNLGDRASYLHTALRAVSVFATIEETSHLYQTPAAYVTDQPDFLNAVCRVRTRLLPYELLYAIEAIMADMGRVRTTRYGPRVVDIDILLFDDLQLETNDLTIPHPRMAERDFVLEPLCDIAPDLQHPTLNESMADLWWRLQGTGLPKVTPFGNQLWIWGAKTFIMGIINATPDSFSGDGLGEVNNATVALAVEQAQHMVAAGADCLDVGAHSTRPGHGLLPEWAEVARIVPVIQALVQAVDVPISVDTFRSGVARAAIEAGVHGINDVWGLRFDPQLATIAAEFYTPLMLMHSRLAVGYWAQLDRPPLDTAYAYGDIVDDVQRELGWSLRAAQDAGVPRWHLITDPGVGFGKTPAQSLELIDRLAELKALGYPLLFGSSRKGFIGKALGGLPPEERVEGTVATSVLAIDRGADILRVHDVAFVQRAARMTDAVVRR